jgi:hypothetical protein
LGAYYNAQLNGCLSTAVGGDPTAWSRTLSRVFRIPSGNGEMVVRRSGRPGRSAGAWRTEVDDMAAGTEDRSKRPWIIGGALAGVVVIAGLAFGVFGVQTLFFDREVDEAGPTFDSGATAPPADDGATSTPAASPTDVAGDTADGPAPDAPDAPGTSAPAAPEVPVVEEVARGAFEPGDHPGTGTAVILSDGQQAFVRFEEDFATDNGPDLYAIAYVGGARIELGVLKGNQGAQNYEVPDSIDPAAIESVAVWCKRFDSTFTTAPLG